MTEPTEPRAVAELSPDERRAFFRRDAGVDAVREDVCEILDEVETTGDAALRQFSEEFDDVTVGNIDVTDEAERAADAVDDDSLTAIREAAANIRSFHERQVPDDWTEEVADGRTLGRRVAVATPPAEELNPVTLAAIHEAGADAVYAVGGAQAVGGLAYGTETIDSVRKIVGPGNRWVTAAKAAVRGTVEIDFLAGPSEVLVVADEQCEPGYVAADLLAQAEHDPNASVVAVTDDEAVATAIASAVDDRLADRERAETIREAFANEASGVLHARSMSEAVLFAEEYAAEHLSIQTADPEALLERGVRRALRRHVPPVVDGPTARRGGTRRPLGDDHHPRRGGGVGGTRRECP
jgi:histidinol dehydrogenase